MNPKSCDICWKFFCTDSHHEIQNVLYYDTDGIVKLSKRGEKKYGKGYLEKIREGKED